MEREHTDTKGANRYAHLVQSAPSSGGRHRASGEQQQQHQQQHHVSVRHDAAKNSNTSHAASSQQQHSAVSNNQEQQQQHIPSSNGQNGAHISSSSSSSSSVGGATKSGAGAGQKRSMPQSSYYHNSFSNLEWREQWLMLKERTLEKVDEPACQRKLIMLIVCTALLLDNMLYMVIVPIIPDYLRSIGVWTTHTEHAEWHWRNTSRGHGKWVQRGGVTVYEGEDSAVGLLFASKAIVQLIANPFSGAIADRIGYEIPMMFGLIVMFLSTIVFACGQTYSVLFLARSLQGVGSAFADTPGIAMLADRFTEESERRRAQGIAIAFISFGCLVAPPFGSVLYQSAGKEVPFILLSLVCLIDSSLLLLVTPPGTFSQIWGKGAACVPGAAPPQAAAKQQQQQQQQQRRPQPQQKPQQQPQPQPQQECDLEQAGNKKRTALHRQKSVSRRHSITLSAGEAPKGTPILVLLRDPCIACCAGALVVANVSLAFLEPTISIWIKRTMPDQEQWEGMIWLPAFFPHVLGVFSTLHLAEKYPRSTWLIATTGLVVEGVGCLMVPLCGSVWALIVPISVICFGVALIDTAILPSLGYLVDTRFTSVYGSVYAIADISYSVSYAIGPIIAGEIVETIGFTALNFLIAIVTLGYTPVLSMLRNIHDYEPFEADQSGLAAGRAKPFGQFGRAGAGANALASQDSADDDNLGPAANSGSESLKLQHRNLMNKFVAGPPDGPSGASNTAYGSPAWAAVGGGCGGAPDKPAGQQRPSSARKGATRVAKSVTIVEEQHQRQDDDDDHDHVAHAPQQMSRDAQSAKNPFLT